MLIKVKTSEHSFSIPFPVTIFLNGITAGIAEKAINKKTNDIKISRGQLNTLFKDVKKSKKTLKKIKAPLLYVKSSSGEEVTITL